jgi:hypothetical protein
LEDKTFCHAYLDSFPNKWVMAFGEIKTADMDNTTQSAITAFMTKQEIAAMAAQLENEAKQKANKKCGTPPNNGSDTNITPSSKKQCYNQTGCQDGKKNSSNHNNFIGPPKPNEKCHLHPYKDHA